MSAIHLSDQPDVPASTHLVIVEAVENEAVLMQRTKFTAELSPLPGGLYFQISLQNTGIRGAHLK